MSFIETPRFPDKISFGATGGPEYQTDVVVRGSGFEQRNINWDTPRARYSVNMALVTADKEIFIAFFRSVKGRAHGFRLRDWSDYQVTIANGRLGLATNATGVPAYQLYKYYATGLLYEYRKISKPVAGTVTVYRAGVAAGASIDTATGFVTFAADASRAISAVTIAASPVITLASAIGLGIGGKLYITGVVGTSSTVLNGIAHTITAVSGAQYTISTSTLGLTYTSGGTASSYPQPSEALTWAGQFDVPVRFDVEYPGISIEAPGVYRATATLIEVRV